MIVERRSRLVITAILATILIATIGASSDNAVIAADAPQTAESILQRAFMNRYGVNLTAELELQIHGATGDPQTRILNAATLQKGDDYYALGQLSAPEYLRGMTLLTISSAGGRLEAFVYLPSLRKSRRIATIHRDDRFLGSDLTYEDFERRYAEDCKSTMLPDGTVDGESVFRIECTPIKPMSYDSAVFSIAKSDWTILSFEEFRGNPKKLHRQMKVSRSQILDIGGHSIPIQLRFEMPAEGSHTIVTVRDLRAEELDANLFRVSALERKHDLRRLLRRSGGKRSE